MKLNLLFDNPQGVRGGYINLDPLCQDESTSNFFRREDIKTLDCIDDAECEEIMAIDVIDYFKAEDAKELVGIWAKKLKHGGLIVLGFIDVYQLTKTILGRSIDINKTNELMHGKQDKGWKTIRSSLSMEYVTNLLEGHGFHILSKRFNGYNAIVKARRP